MSAENIDEGTLEKIWSNLMNHLCPRHRTNARNERPTDYKIEQLRNDYYGSYEVTEYFRRHITELANRHQEIEVAGGADIVRITLYGLGHCGDYDSTWQRDF